MHRLLGERRAREGPGLRRLLLLGVLFAGLALLAGCGDDYPQIVKDRKAAVTGRVTALAQTMASGGIRNANLITEYARLVRADRPELARLTTELEKEGTTDGLALGSLVKRLQAVNVEPRDEAGADASLEELLRIEAASDPEVFNDSLIDVVNVLADLSQGKLAKLHVPASEGAPAAGPGGHLVGNPRYGEWRTNSSGGSFWVFYGQYALMRDLLFRPAYYRYGYGTWYGHRGWSYYGDVGRHYYGTRTDSQRWNRATRTYPAPPRKSYGPVRSQRRLSTYGRTSARSPGSALRRVSSYSRSSGSGRRASSYAGSARRSSYRGK